VNTRPERRLIHLKLITENVTPDSGTTGAAIDRMGDPSPQHPAVRKIQLIGDVVGARSTPGVPYPTPALDLTKES
jgi:hypothetical protein